VSAANLLNLLVGSVELVLAAVVLRHLGRFGRAFPWLGALTVFFAVRAADRIYTGIAGREPAALVYLVDALVLLSLALLLVGIERMVTGLRIAQDEAHYRQAEYQRALEDYRRLARHRLANPLTAIRGGLATLREVDDLSAAEAQEMLRMIDTEAARLEQVTLDPRDLRPEEAGLHPHPNV
jgi:signal transduction histidine kinase